MATVTRDYRSKNWVIIVYPESLPENWEQLLRDLKVDIIISPLHDKDKNPDGTLKKPHYHVVLMFSSNKSFAQVKDLVKPLNCPAPQKVASIKGQVRYLVHIDNPEKAQYNQTDIKVIGSVDLARYFKFTENDRHNHIAEMIDFIDEQGIMEFNKLLKYARKERRDDWFPLLCDNSAYVIDKYICSIRNEVKDREERERLNGV